MSGVKQKVVKGPEPRLATLPFPFWVEPGTFVPRSEDEKERTFRDFGLAMDRVNRGDTAEIAPNLRKLVQIVCESPVSWGYAKSIFGITDISDRYKAAYEILEKAPAGVARKVMEESIGPHGNKWEGAWAVVRDFALDSEDPSKVILALLVAKRAGNLELLKEIAEKGKTPSIRQSAKDMAWVSPLGP